MTRDIWDQCRIPDKDIVFPRQTWGGIWGRALVEKKTLYSNEPFRVPEGHILITRALDVPIIYEGDVIGNLFVGNKATDYDEKDRDLLENIARHVAPVLHARLQRDTEETERKKAEEAHRSRIFALTQPDVEVGTLKLTEVLGLEILQRIQDGFATSYGIPAIIYGLDGTPITEPSQFTDFCKFVRSTPKGNKNCKAFDAKLIKILSRKPEPYIRKGCALKNIITGTVPIVIQGHHLANFGIGQMIDEDFDFDEIKRYAREIGVDENDLLEAVKTLILVSKEKFESAVRFLNILAEQLSLLG